MNENGGKPLPPLDPVDIARFWSQVDVRAPDECWPWKGSQFTGGYGQFKVGKRTVKAHRVAFRVFHGTDPVGQLVCHHCDNPPCCNGAHLYAGDSTTNYADIVARSRGNPACGERHGSRTHPERWARGERVYGAKLTAAQVVEIRSLYLEGGHTHQSIADRYGISREAVGVILRGERWAHIPFDPDAVRRVSGVNRGKPGAAHGTAKLDAEQVRDIRRRYAEGGVSHKRLATEYGVSAENIAAIVQRRTWKHVA